MEDGPKGGGEDRASSGGVVPASGVHCDEFNLAESGSRAFLQQARDSRAVDQGRQAGGEDDAAQLPQVPVERGSAVAEHHCL